MPDFDKANLALQDLYNRLHKEKRNWCRVCIVLAIVVAVEAIGIVATAMISKPYPWIVQVDEHGFAVSIGPAGSQTVPQSVVIYEIANFIKSSRTIITDPQGQKALVDWSYAAVASESKAAAKLEQEQKKHNPYKRASEGETVEIKIHNILPKSEKTFQANWTEITRKGDAPEIVDYTGLFSVDISTPKTGEEIMNNPCGVYITEYNFAPNYVQE